VSVAVPALAIDPTAQTPPAAAVAVASVPPGPAGPAETKSLPETPPAPVSPAGGTQRTIGWVTAGVGLVGVGIGTAFGLATESKNSDAKGLCPTLSCTQQVVDDHASLVSTAKSDRTASIIGFAAGGAALVGGVVLVLTAPRAHASKESALRLVPLAGPGLVGGSFGGSF
jgi:hypothetical protein